MLGSERPARICLACGNNFKGYGNRPMKYCGRACSAAARATGKNLIESKCVACGKPILAYTKRKFCNKQCESDRNRSQIPVSREWLEEKYINERMDANAIAKIVERDGKTVWSWLKMHEIPTRPRGSYALSNPSFTYWDTPGLQHPMKGRKHSEETCRKQSEIAKAQGRVPYDPAVGSYMKGRKGSQVPNWKGGITPERQAFYSSKEWKNVVKLVWARDDATCQRCSKRNSRGQRYAFDIHHVVSFACRELRAELSNLVLLCEECHYWVHGSENTDNLFIKEHDHVAN